LPPDDRIGDIRYTITQRTATGFKGNIQQFSLSSGVTGRLSWRAMGPAVKAEHGEAPPPQPVKLKTFDPVRDEPTAVRGVGVSVESSSLRIDKTDGMLPGEVTFFDMHDRVPESGVLICRAKMRSMNVKFLAAPFWLCGHYSSEFGLNSPTRAAHLEGDVPEWMETEARFPAYISQWSEPPAIMVSLYVTGEGTIWIKDIVLEHIPALREPAERRPSEVVVKSYTWRDKPIQQDYRNETLDGWRWVANDRTIRLFELKDLEVGGSRLIFRVRLKTIGTRVAAYPEMTY
jgi:hypothetical protein